MFDFQLLALYIPDGRSSLVERKSGEDSQISRVFVQSNGFLSNGKVVSRCASTCHTACHIATVTTLQALFVTGEDIRITMMCSLMNYQCQLRRPHGPILKRDMLVVLLL
jgi:hypothetical protein